MQLLEQLASGYNEVVESDILVECASIYGYLECMDELMERNILTECTVMEGLDIREIGRKIVLIIKKLIDRAMGLFKKLSSFFKSKAKETSDDAKPNTFDTHKNDWEIADEELRKYPFTGVDTRYLKMVLFDINCAISLLGLNGISPFCDIVKFVHSKHNYSETNTIPQAILDILSDNGASATRKIYDFTNSEVLKDFIGASLESPNDLKKLPSMCYDHEICGDRIYDKKILTWGDVQYLNNGYNEVLRVYSGIYQDMQKELDSYIKELKSYADKLDKLSIESPEDLKLIQCGQNIIGTSIQCYTSLSMGIPPVIAKSEAELDNLKKYIDNLAKNILALKNIGIL